MLFKATFRLLHFNYERILGISFMTGRKLFHYLAPLINTLVSLFRLLPKFIRYFIWDISSVFEGKLSILTRYIILASLSNKVGKNIYVGKNVTIKSFESLNLGSNISIHANSYIDASGGVYIHDNVSIAHNSSIISFEHTWENLKDPIKYNPTVLKEIVIFKDVWIGCGVRVLAGAVINTRTVVAAGSVVKGGLDEKSIYAGVPAKKVRDI